MNRALLFCVLMLLLPLATAQQQARHWPTPEEFAQQFPLSVSGRNGVVQLRLPLAVYQASRNADLRDLRVYNDAGQILPHALYHPAPRHDPVRSERPAVVFPIHADAHSDAEPAANLELTLRADGSLTLQQSALRSAAPGARLRALILDLGPEPPEQTLESLELRLPEAQTDYRARLSIERSEDLKLWDTVAHSPVDWIGASDGSRRLVNDRIALARGSGRYLRVHWLAGEPLVFASAIGHWRGSSRLVESSLELSLQAQPGRHPGDWLYRASPAIAASAIGLELPEENTVLPVTVGFYHSVRRAPPQASGWQFDGRVQSTFYRLNADGRERRSSRIRIAPMAASEWVVRPVNPVAYSPALVLEWQPHTLVFTAQGSGFHLAVGADSERVRHWQGGAQPLQLVAPGFSADELLTLEVAGIGAAATVTPTASAEHAPSDEDAARTRRTVLWSVLVLGVLVLAGLTWHLFRQMSASDHSE